MAVAKEQTKASAAQAADTADGSNPASTTESEGPHVVSGTKQPPPETSYSIASRRYILLALWSTIVLLGLPIWIWTTTVHRATLPLDSMNEWAGGQACQLEFPIHVSIDSDSLRPQDTQQVVRLVQQTLDDHHVASLHHLRIAPSGSTNQSTSVIVKLRSTPDQKENKATLLRYEPTLEVLHAPFQPAPHSSGLAPLASFIASELRTLFQEEQSVLIHLLANAGRPIPNAPKSPDLTESLNQRSTRTFKYAPTYHLTFSLFSGEASPSAWDIKAAIDEYLQPLVASFSAISTFTIDTQVQLYASLPPSMQGPTLDDNKKQWTLARSDLSGFINAAEWPLSPSIGAGPTINFVLYTPSEKQRPLLLEETGGTSWLIPQWGGVQILNPTKAQHERSALTKQDLQPIIATFADQLVTLLGLPKSPASIPIQLGSLTRERTASLILSASSTLGALSRLTLKLTSIAIPDSVASSVDKTVHHLDQACTDLRHARYDSALNHARTAETEAEQAFFEPSMVGQVYFPDEHKVAVYVPLLGPMAVPLVMAVLKEPDLRDCGVTTLPHTDQRHLSTMDRQKVQQSCQAILDNFTKDPQKLPGVVVATIDKNGDIIAANASGKRSLNSNKPMDLDTVFWIASCTKLLTAIVCLQLVEQGKLELDDSKHLYQYCPELAEVKVLQDDGSLVNKKSEITLRMLLIHTSGFGYEFFNEKLRDYYYPVGVSVFDGARADFLNMPLVNQPGERWEYGIGIDWAGFYCERVTGIPLNDLMMQNIIKPLGLESTTMFPTKSMMSNLAGMHQRYPGSDTLHVVDHPMRAVFRNMPEDQKKYYIQSGGAGLFSKPTDYLQVLATLLNEGTSPKTGARILSSKTVDEMFKNQIPQFGQFGRQGIPAAKPEWTNPLPDMMPQQGNPDQGWGLSMALNIQPGDTGRSGGAGGWAGIANLFYFIDREKGVASMVCSQVLPFADINLLTAWFLCEQELYKAINAVQDSSTHKRGVDSVHLEQLNLNQTDGVSGSG
ncbi:beta-lactamase/transpeptidase-like protein [Myriangium duriaei CBS 260.36]|uniref:Beta-lactamase/transpeptidase-like protein n=1 Tax=Myriangium duriaei CBS 260.36 TaxID=1168546 RepID=A0A9P4IXY1_9PEZI|nr:beta-lactamase/transpeptidase-like protein [Myriangium duriaei CBS 260.36]